MVKRVRKGSKGPQGQTVYFKNFFIAYTNSLDEIVKYNVNCKQATVKVAQDIDLTDVEVEGTGITTGITRECNDDNRLYELLASYKEEEQLGKIVCKEVQIIVSMPLYDRLNSAGLLV